MTSFSDPLYLPVARHVGGYKKVLDGDLDTSMKDYFNEP